MKKFNYFLLPLIILFCTTPESKAFTTTIKNHLIAPQAIEINPQIENNGFHHLITSNTNFALNESNFSSASSASSIGQKLTILYSICIALVLINLVVQIKIIFQMIHLFFLVRKKDDFATFEF